MLVFDTTCLGHFTLAERLDVLHDLVIEDVCRTTDVVLWLLARACRDGKVTEVSAGNLIERLRDTGMRLPCTGRDFGAFCRRPGIL